MTDYAIGWDIGGAHVKVAVIYQQKILAVHQYPCPLWQGLSELENAVHALIQQLPVDKPHRHAITMTGELVDLFKNRHDGVAQIIHTMQHLLSKSSLHVFCGGEGLLPILDITIDHYDAIASANWLASSTLAAKKNHNGLFVDIGSTTTDILLFENGVVNAQGDSDYARLISQELVYTGIVRTAVMAVVHNVVDNLHTVGVMAEYFATMADVYRLTGELCENHDQTPTADGADKSIEASARRLSRMIGADFSSEELSRWKDVATHIRHAQQVRIQESCTLHLARHSSRQALPLIGAGIGRFLVKDIATTLNCPYIDFSTLFESDKTEPFFSPADCAPAVAVAMLLN
jgi:probable H4MPT-linked C1 transfer pathway protein